MRIINVFKRVIAFNRVRKDFESDFVISFGTSANIVNVLSKHIGKTIISFRGFASIKRGNGSVLCCRLADSVFCISDNMRRQLVKLCPFAAKKTSVVYNGIDVDSINRLSWEPISFSVAHPAFVSIGRLEDVKGHKHLLKAYKIVHTVIPESSLVLIGDGSNRESLERIANELDIKDSVVFVGQQVNPFPFIRGCDIAVQTSITEGFSNAILESGVCGLPVIHTDCPSGPREILSLSADYPVVNQVFESDFGILVPPFTSNDSDEPQKDDYLAQAMISLAIDSAKRGFFSSRLRERVNDFSIDVYKRNLERLIR